MCVEKDSKISHFLRKSGNSRLFVTILSQTLWYDGNKEEKPRGFPTIEKERTMKKKFLTMLALMVMTACLCAVSAFAMPGELMYVNNTNGTGVNMRSGPGTGYAIVATYPNGTEMYVVTADMGSGWTQVSFDSTTGWMATYLLSNNRPAQGGASGTFVAGDKSGQYRTITGQGVNLRSGPGTNYSVLTTMPAGAQVAVLDYSNGWAHVYYLTNYEGYCSTAYVSGLGGTTSTTSKTSSTTKGNPDNTWYGGKNYANVYDYYNYRTYNPDLVAQFGNNVDAYLKHFVTYGMSEGRQAINSFNVYTYRSQHPDLEQRFGDDLRMYYLYACGLA